MDCDISLAHSARQTALQSTTHSRPQTPFIIGTRGSPLALWQARRVQSLLTAHHDWDADAVQIQILTTKGDQLKGALSQFGGKGLFTRELEEALVDGRIDLAVHSMKDVPTLSQDALMIAAVLEREDPRDGFISSKVARLLDLPHGAMVGTASIRRRAQLSRLRPDMQFCLLRGNVGTRLSKLQAGEFDATFLACAGLRRLAQADAITEAVPPEIMLPAPAQGAIGIEIRKDDARVRDAVEPLNHHQTLLAITAERAFLRALDGSCRTPIAALAEINGDALSFRGEVIATDGSKHFGRQSIISTHSIDDAFALGHSLGEDIRTEIGDIALWDRTEGAAF